MNWADLLEKDLAGWTLVVKHGRRKEKAAIVRGLEVGQHRLFVKLTGGVDLAAFEEYRPGELVLLTDDLADKVQESEGGGLRIYDFFTRSIWYEFRPPAAEARNSASMTA